MPNFPIRGASRILLACVAALWALGCSAPPPAPVADKAAKSQEAAADVQRVAEGALGMHAEVIAHGDLARNGLEQLLVVNRSKSASGEAQSGDSAHLLVTRATIVQKQNGKWSEVLRCDEHLKNPNGYLGGSPVTPVTSWQLQIAPDTKQGLALKFTPEEQGSEISVRWNVKTARYQSLNRSNEKYLSEVPTLDTPQSVLR